MHQGSLNMCPCFCYNQADGQANIDGMLQPAQPSQQIQQSGAPSCIACLLPNPMSPHMHTNSQDVRPHKPAEEPQGRLLVLCSHTIMHSPPLLLTPSSQCHTCHTFMPACRERQSHPGCPARSRCAQKPTLDTPVSTCSTCRPSHTATECGLVLKVPFRP
jgi:hypothetical protein